MRISKPPYTSNILAGCLALSLCFLTSIAAQAKLGEPLKAFKARTAKLYKPTQDMPGTDGKSMNHIFEMIVTDKKAAISPGYAVGVTITTVNDKIVGQSMAIRSGATASIGTSLAAQDAYEFAIDAAGKPKPAKKEDALRELQSFTEQVNRAYLGQTQYIRYPNVKAQIILSFDRMGNLLVAVTPI
jgi:hypothetical protein